MRSHYCGDITSLDIGKDIEVSGWVHKRRDHGGVIFLDIRDLHGIVQVVFNPDHQNIFDLRLLYLNSGGNFYYLVFNKNVVLFRRIIGIIVSSI